jgi:predicted PurR-regulated permease PerM
MNLIQFAKHVAVVVLIALALVTLWAAGSAVAIFLASLAVAATLHPQVEYFKGRGWPSGAAASVVAGTCVLVLTVLVALLGPPLVANLKTLESDVSLAAASFADSNPDHWLVKMARPRLEVAAPPAADAPPLANLGGLLLKPLVGTAAGLVQFSALCGICCALAFYWTLDRERFERLWLSLVPVRRRVGAQRMWQAIEREVGAYLRSEVIQFLLAVVLLWAIFLILDLRYAALAAVVAGTLTLIPWLGTLFASAVVLLITSPKLTDWSGAWATPQSWLALGAIVLVLCLLEFVVEPRLFQRERYNPLWIALTAILMASLWGLWGLFFGPLVGYVLQILVRQVYPRLVQVQPRITSDAMLHERLGQLEERFTAQEEVPPELISLKQRLVELIERGKAMSGTG